MHFYTQTNTFTHKHLTHKPVHTQTLFHTEAFTHRHFYIDTHTPFCTQTLLHTDLLAHRQTLFTHKPFYTQTLWHRNLLPHRSCDPRTPFIFTQKQPFTLKHFCTQKLLHTHTPNTHTPIYTRTFLHTDPPAHRHKLSHTNTLTQKPFDPQKLRHTDHLSHKCLHSYTHILLHPTPVTSQLYFRFCTSRHFRAKGLLWHN